MSVKRAECPKCHQAFGVLERQLGSEVYCPHCGQKIRTVAPKPVARQSAQEDAISQLARPAAPPSDLPVGQQGVADMAADALGAATAGATAGAAPGEFQAKDVPMAQPLGRPGSDTALARNLGLDQQPEPIAALATAPVRSKAGVWIWSTIVLLALVGVVVGIIVSNQQRDRSRGNSTAVSDTRSNGTGRRPAASAAIPQDEDQAVVSARAHMRDLEEADARKVDPAEKVPSPLKIHVYNNNTQNYGPEGSMREVLFGTVQVQNDPGRTVRRAFLNMSVEGGESGRVYGEASIRFCDVKPDEVVWFAFDYPYFDEGGKRKWPYSMNEGTPEQAEFDFSVTVHRERSDGRTSGVVPCDVKNESPRRAPRVDLLLVFLDRDGRPVGCARERIFDIGAGATKEVKVRWEHCDAEDIHQVRARAQIAPIE
jgi:DNA-directed RNA polymerase subunit RPC12/RpoP